MRMGVEYSFTIAVGGYEVVARPLSVAETLRINSDVAERLSMMRPEQRTSLAESVLLAKATLIQASASADGKVLGRLTEPILSRMTTQELDFLFKAYVDACEKLNPSLERMSTEDIVKLTDHLKKNTAEAESILTALSRRHLVQLALSLLTPPD
jgi:hypothetical protein